jgi:CxxC motif-containing protein (DUF1111 family)
MILLLIACTGEKVPIDIMTPDADIYVEELGDAVSWLPSEFRENYDRGQVLMADAISTDQGLGPFFNADSCASCHQAPVSGGSAPRYRDLWLIKKERWDGALESAGTNETSPVRSLYAKPPLYHVPEDIDTVIYARRNTPPMFGVGLFAFIDDEIILANADPNDMNEDGISGRTNFEQGQVGRFGYKSQAATLESFNRGALFNQMGVTTDPLFFTFPEIEARNHRLIDWFISSAWAQVSAPDEPTIDDDGIDDPELSYQDQLDILIFSTYIGVPQIQEFSQSEKQGETLFASIGCADCHIPRLQSQVGPLRLYSDLLLHDMGEELADDIEVGFASGAEFRTQPLWGVILHGPFLHDGRADTLQDAIEWHGGESLRSKDAWLALSNNEKEEILLFLEALGGEDPVDSTFVSDSTEHPAAGEEGGPLPSLPDELLPQWEYGRKVFDQNYLEENGLGEFFNADSCRSCHQDPVIGGAGGLDVNVLRYGRRDEVTGEYSNLDFILLRRVSQWGVLPQRIPEESNVIEARNPPTTLGLGLIESISMEEILRNSDPNDENEDGVSGRPRMIGEEIGKYGWKADVPTITDFIAAAMFNEIGITIHPSLSDFTSIDDDECQDPELSEDDLLALKTYLEYLNPPVRQEVNTNVLLGEELFQRIGCSDCHVSELDGVHLYSDLLLHDVVESDLYLVEQDDGVLATEFRTPPLWGLSNTGPYLHDGSAATVLEAIRQGHFNEAQRSKEAFLLLSAQEEEQVLAFLLSL